MEIAAWKPISSVDYIQRQPNGNSNMQMAAV
jgi:hypothetical protein